MATAGVVVFLVATFLDWVSTDNGSVTGSADETDTSIPLVAFLGLGLAAALLYALNRARGRQHRGLSLATMAAGIAAAGLALSYLLDAPGALERGGDYSAEVGTWIAPGRRDRLGRRRLPAGQGARGRRRLGRHRPRRGAHRPLTTDLRGPRCNPRARPLHTTSVRPGAWLRGGHLLAVSAREPPFRWWVFTPYMARSARPINSSRDFPGRPMAMPTLTPSVSGPSGPGKGKR